MTRTITRSEFQNAAGEAVYVSHVHYQSRAEQAAGDAACQAVVVPAAFVPALSAGPAFDSPEYSPQGVSANYAPEGVSGGAPPPNCDFGTFDQAIAAPEAGTLLAHAQHEAATDGDECSSGVCLMTRGAND